MRLKRLNSFWPLFFFLTCKNIQKTEEQIIQNIQTTFSLIVLLFLNQYVKIRLQSEKWIKHIHEKQKVYCKMHNKPELFMVQVLG